MFVIHCRMNDTKFGDAVRKAGEGFIITVPSGGNGNTKRLISSKEGEK